MLYFWHLGCNSFIWLLSTWQLCNRLFCSAASARPSCDELDIWEANSLTNVYTTHPCLNGQCDPYGCGFNTYARGEKNFYGRGPGYQVDSTQKFTVVTRFVTVDGTDNGDLKEILALLHPKRPHYPTARQLSKLAGDDKYFSR